MDKERCAENNMAKHLQEDGTARFSVQFESVKRLSDFLEWRNGEYRIPSNTLKRIHVCADELMSNIVRYSKASFAHVAYRLGDNEVLLDFYDDGVPFNPLSKKDADVTLPAEERMIGGLGIMMVKRLTKAFEYEYLNKQNHVSLVFKCE